MFLVNLDMNELVKHIYAGTQRIASKLGDIDAFGADPRRVATAGHDVDGAEPIDFGTKYKNQNDAFTARFDSVGAKFNGKSLDDYINGKSFCCNGNSLDEIEKNNNQGAENAKFEDNLYFYHPDHLGSTNLITNFDGEVTQSVAYVPYGEVFVEERNGIWATPFLFNAKELDEETGLYYYGARYLNPTDCRWLSPDPMWEKNIDATPYNYCHGNPIVKVDVDGNTDFYVEGDYSTHQYVEDGVHEVIALTRENYDILASVGFDVNAEEYNCVLETGRVDDSMFPTINNVLNENKYVSYCDYGNCFDAATKQNTNKQTGPQNRIDLYNPDNKNTSIQEGTNYIVSQLKEGKSIITGVYDGAKHGNANPKTGHFLNICGMGFDQKGNNYFTYFDNAPCNETKGTDMVNNRFYKGTTQTGLSVWYDNTNLGVRGVSLYIISEVRRNK